MAARILTLRLLIASLVEHAMLAVQEDEGLARFNCTTGATCQWLLS
jgi:hypothetical protein